MKIPQSSPSSKVKCDSSSIRSCFRCGSEFSTSDRERVCWICRRPKRFPTEQQKELTFRERQIVDLVAEGKANKEIAYRLLLTEGTIKEYLNRIFRKVSVANRTELAVWSLKQHQAESKTSCFESRPAFNSRSLII